MHVDISFTEATPGVLTGHWLPMAMQINFAGGINLPKLVRAADTRGGRHRHLVKSGSDDLRQDAVMQQVGFGHGMTASHHITERAL